MDIKRREDIDGLRALAVIAVLIFHFDNGYIRGGFIGVDIFFVISGYLMTKIIFNSLNEGRFNYFYFIWSRANRIIPALIVVVFLLLVFGFLFIDSANFSILGKHAKASILFFSNYIYFLESGYFDKSSLEKFLLHTWSLSVEWQFYLIYPLLLCLFYKVFKSKGLLFFLLFLCISLLMYSMLLVKQDRDYAYYSLQSRAWEMLAGTVVFFLPKIEFENNYKKIIEFLSILVILFFVFYANEIHGWPNYWTIFPVFFTAIIIWNSNKGGIFSNRIIQYFGRISYSLYLVHWCILVAAKKIYVELVFFVYLTACVFFASLLYVYVEKRSRLSWGFLFFSVFILFLSMFAEKDGMNFRLKDNSAFNLSLQEYRDLNEGHDGVRDNNEVVMLNSENKKIKFVLIGSSHAKHYISYINKNAIPVASFALDGCNSTRNYFSKYNAEVCKKRYSEIIEYINKNKGLNVIWAATWKGIGVKRDNNFLPKSGRDENWSEELEYFLEDIKNSGSKIYLVGATQGSRKIMHECIAKNNLPINILFDFACKEKQEKIKNVESNDFLQELSNKYKNVYFIKSEDALCNDVECMVVADGIPVYTDYGHLSKRGADIVGEYIFEYINKN